MQIVHLKTNFWGYPTLKSWAPVAHNGAMKGMAVQLGRPVGGNYPLSLWIDIREDGPEVVWDWKRNWLRPFIRDAEPKTFGTVSDVLALVRRSDEDFASDAILLLIDLHSGKKPHQNLADESKGGFLAAMNHELSKVYSITQQDHYPVGMIVIYPGYQAWVRAEALQATHTLVYPSAERGVYLTPNNPVMASGPSVAGHYHGYGWSSAVAAITRQQTEEDIGPFKI
ncbi:MAG: hypothetical protein GW762_01610 [Candidatus Pacebacteria bacterium]|nr:hypothetical protein [Candidatus Paceibacterota bacterium]PIR63360.1 MAG: hypothetical protein COU64_04760 [Candidatus Pacebacteria bacterium CG10_big_fil_rev_8_21_14_0_10_40_26]PIZ79108.1 MAG: hypothetical protein COY01_01630 [Candidatus Pacebacteria bacterium CG_4_10_14_0_2_um_filter_40_20]PJA69204.1 MAG: hypothetical protein CO156_01205 [Candidatus Pacebacteria bacterium CG_4_9_14_3_um_filter_40_12]PJC42074.1 MAG: hypothetical protein CO041_00340 [Candidatus Pacebacteria bacterium CG_4_9_